MPNHYVGDLLHTIAISGPSLLANPPVFPRHYVRAPSKTPSISFAGFTVRAEALGEVLRTLRCFVQIRFTVRQ